MFLVSYFAFGQKIELKKDIVYVDKAECLKYSSAFMGDTTDFYSLSGEKLFYMDIKDAGKYSAGYLKIGFTGTDYVLTLKNEFTRKQIIRRLIEEKVLVDCKLNLENIKDFINRYDQKYEGSIIR